MSELSEREIANRRAFVQLSNRLKAITDGDQQLWRLLNISVGRVLIRYVDRDEPNISAGLTVNAYAQAIYHIKDWLKASLVNDLPWLRNLDAKDRPKKLMKCRDIDALVHEADKDMRKQNAAIARKPLAKGEEVLEFQCADGWSIVRLLTPSALDRESVVMQHCIGNGAYDERLTSEQFRYFSLRDPAGKRHGTMEVSGSTLLQFYGKQNAVPIEKYLRIALPFFNERRIDCGLSRCGLITDVDGQTYLVSELPEELVVSGRHVVLTSTPERKLTLPKIMRIEGKLTLIGVFENIPECMVVAGDLEIGLVAEDGSPGGSSGETSFSRLPQKIHVTHNMYMRYIPVTELPDGMRVEGYLDMAGAGVTSLPECLRCGSLDISYTQVKAFDTVHFISDETERASSRMFMARSSKLESLVGSARFSQLDLAGTKMTSLPDGLYVERDLNIGGTPITVLPEDMEIGGSLYADRCPITCLPPRLNVKGGAHFDNSVVRFPHKFSMPGSLYVRRGEIEVMAEDIEAEDIVVYGTKLSGIPTRIRTGKLHLDETAVRRIEGDVSVVELEVCEDFSFLGDAVRISKSVSVHCRDRKKGPSYCIAELTEGDARAMLKKKGKLDFRGTREVPKIPDPDWDAKVRAKFHEIFGLDARFGAAA
jgi:hypothetical protein